MAVATLVGVLSGCPNSAPQGSFLTRQPGDSEYELSDELLICCDGEAIPPADGGGVFVSMRWPNVLELRFGVEDVPDWLKVTRVESTFKEGQYESAYRVSLLSCGERTGQFTIKAYPTFDPTFIDRLGHGERAPIDVGTVTVRVTCGDPGDPGGPGGPGGPGSEAIVFANTPPDTSLETDSEIWVLDAAGARPLTDNSVEDTDPAWSSDRSEIAFLRLQSARWVLAVMDADGSNQRVEEDFDPDGALHPAWSPTGRKIAVSAGNHGLGQGGIWVIDLDQVPAGSAGRRLELTSGAYDLHPTWSPDGNEIAFERENEGIYKVPADGSSGPTPVYTDASRAPAAPHWGLDGFVLQAYDVAVFGYRIARIDDLGAGFDGRTAGGNQIGDYVPKWSADSERIIFVREPTGEGASRLRIGDAEVLNGDSEVAGQPDGDNTDPDW